MNKEEMMQLASIHGVFTGGEIRNALPNEFVFSIDALQDFTAAIQAVTKQEDAKIFEEMAENVISATQLRHQQIASGIRASK